MYLSWYTVVVIINNKFSEVSLLYTKPEIASKSQDTDEMKRATRCTQFLL